MVTSVVVAGSATGEEPSGGDVNRLIQNPFNECRVWKKSGLLVKQTRRELESPIPVP